MMTYDRIIPALMERTAVPGLSLAYLEHGVLHHSSVFGVRSLASYRPVSLETVFEAASLSKPVFAYAVLKLWEDGELDLDAPLYSYLSESEHRSGMDVMDRWYRMITARHVLTHTSGMGNWQPDLTGRIAAEPGTQFAYSGEGFMYLQDVVERITNTELGPYMREHVLLPLGMVDSSYVWLDRYAAQAAEGHGEGRSPGADGRWPRALAAYSLYSTPNDLARFVGAILTADQGDRFRLCRATVDHMLSPHVQIANRIAWGLGWGLQTTAQGLSFWHWGDLGNFQSYVAASRETRRGLVVMTNSSHGLSIFGDIATAALGEDYAAGVQTVLEKEW